MIYIAFLVFTFLVLGIAFYQWQYIVIFSPTYYRNDDLAKNYEILSLITDDGVELEGVISEPSDATQTLLVFNGRAHDSVGLINKLCEAYPTIRIITFNYRSYGRSQGKASEKKLLKDSLKIAEIIQKYYGDFSVLAYSIGTNLASFLASQHKVNTLFLIAPFHSLAFLIKNKIGLDLKIILRYKFHTAKYIKSVPTPVYIFASIHDEIVDIKSTRALKPFIKSLVYYKELEGIRHDNLMFDAQIITKINEVLDEKNI